MYQKPFDTVTAFVCKRKRIGSAYTGERDEMPLGTSWTLPNNLIRVQAHREGLMNGGGGDAAAAAAGLVPVADLHVD